MINIEVNLTNGEKHKVRYEQDKEAFFDLLKFNRDAFLQSSNGLYFIVSSIASFKVEGENRE